MTCHLMVGLDELTYRSSMAGRLACSPKLSKDAILAIPEILLTPPSASVLDHSDPEVKRIAVEHRRW